MLWVAHGCTGKQRSRAHRLAVRGQIPAYVSHAVYSRMSQRLLQRLISVLTALLPEAYLSFVAYSESWRRKAADDWARYVL